MILRSSESLPTKILLLHAEGFSNRRIARDLEIDRETVTRTLKTTKSHPRIGLLDAMLAHGITPELLAQKLRERIDASEVKVFNGKDGIVYSEPQVAWDVQADTQDMIHRLRGAYAEQKLTVGGTLFHRLLANVPRPALPKAEE